MHAMEQVLYKFQNTSYLSDIIIQNILWDTSIDIFCFTTE